MQKTEFNKLRIFSMKGTNLSVDGMLSRFFTREELTLNHLKHKHIHPQPHFASLTHDYQTKPVHFLVKHENVLPSVEDDCHPFSTHFGNNQFAIRINDNGKKEK